MSTAPPTSSSTAPETSSSDSPSPSIESTSFSTPSSISTSPSSVSQSFSSVSLTMSTSTSSASSSSDDPTSSSTSNSPTSASSTITSSSVSSSASDSASDSASSESTSSTQTSSTDSSSSSSTDPPTTMSSPTSQSSPTSASSESSSSDTSTSSSSPTSPSSGSSSSDSSTSDSTSSSSTTTTTPTPPPTSNTSSSTTDSSSPTSNDISSSPPPTSSSSTTTPSPSPTPTPTPTPTQTREADTSSSSSSVSAQTTLSSTMFFTTTDANGSVTTTAPPQFTSTFTSTNSDGSISTVTKIEQNPTLSSDSGSSHSASQFFSNKGAVAGVFVIVGLAVASVCMWIVFAMRRKRVKRRLETEAAAVGPGGHRSPLHDEDDDEEKMGGMAQRPSSNISYGTTGLARPPSAYNNLGIGEQPQDGPSGSSAFDPYIGFPAAGQNAEGSTSNPFSLNRAVQQGYVPARTSSPPVPASPHSASFGHELNTSGSADLHTRSHSYSSYEPLLTAAGLAAADSAGGGDGHEPTNVKQTPMRPTLDFLNTNPRDVDNAAPPTPPPRSPLRAQHAESAGHSRTSLGTGEASDAGNNRDSRLDPNLAERLKRGNTTASIRDDEDYSRPVLGVRNPDRDNGSVSEYSVHDDS